MDLVSSLSFFCFRELSKTLPVRVKLLSMFDVGKVPVHPYVFSRVNEPKKLSLGDCLTYIIAHLSSVRRKSIDPHIFFSHCQNCFFFLFQCRVPLHLIFDCQWSEEKTLSRLAKLSEMFYVGADGNAEYKTLISCHLASFQFKSTNRSGSP